ncbi:superoxide dismutase [Candidatus Gracilibacteria bacterium]|nr:superoxide dismutase [Candidatus Gracilibacteria bacterium]
MPYEPKPLPFQKQVAGTSEKALQIHHDKLYAGYVSKKNEISTKLEPLSHGGDVSSTNATYSDLRALKSEETFATNGVYLHEWYFDLIGGDGTPQGELVEALKKEYSSLENFINYFKACGMAARGWVVLAWDTHDNALRVYSCDTHNHGGVWGAIPIIVLDVFEHAYFMDYGSDRKTYLEDFFKNLNWQTANNTFTSIKK